MFNATATYVDYQERAAEFSVGDSVVPVGMDDTYAGRVVAVYPAIGMVDVQWVNGNTRMPVEDLQIFVEGNNKILTPRTEDVPGGIDTVSVSQGPPMLMPSAEKVASEFAKRKAIYWQSRDRKYRATKSEQQSSCFYCPKCRNTKLERVIYKRSEGSSDRLLGCSDCLFLVKQSDLEGFPCSSSEPETPAFLSFGNDVLIKLMGR